MKKIIRILFIIALYSPTISSSAENIANPRWLSKEFVFINKTEDTLKIHLSAMTKGVAALEIEPGASKKIKTTDCISLVSIVVGSSWWAGGLQRLMTQDFWVKPLVKCSGVAEITTKGNSRKNKYELKWIQ